MIESRADKGCPMEASDQDSSKEVDPVIEAYKKDVDRTLIRENLKLTVDERLQKLEALVRDLHEMRASMRRATSKTSTGGTTIE